MRISDWSSDVCSSDLIRLAHAFIDHLLQAARAVEAAVHAPFDEDGDDARVLADRPVPLGAHAAVRQYLRHRVLRGGRHFAFIGRAERADIVHRMEIRSEEHTSELQSLMRISYAVFCLKKKKQI